MHATVNRTEQRQHRSSVYWPMQSDASAQTTPSSTCDEVRGIRNSRTSGWIPPWDATRSWPSLSSRPSAIIPIQPACRAIASMQCRHLRMKHAASAIAIWQWTHCSRRIALLSSVQANILKYWEQYWKVSRRCPPVVIVFVFKISKVDLMWS